MISGIIPLDKPIEWTSHDCVDFVRRLTGQKKVGHGGTLDPMATGVLLILLGKATKCFDLVASERKSYTGHIELGISTESDDMHGCIVSETDCGTLPEFMLDEAFASLEGEYEQLIPKISARKIKGKRAYRLARGEVEFEPASKKVTVESFVRLQYLHPCISFFAHVSKGTYIRALARDLGLKLGLPATLSSLRRTQSGACSVEDAIDVARLKCLSLRQIESKALSFAEKILQEDILSTF